MKPSASLCLLLTAVLWLELARSNVRIALATDEPHYRAKYLRAAAEDAARYRRLMRVLSSHLAHSEA